LSTPDLEPDHRSGPSPAPNLGPNHGQVLLGSGSNHGSEPNLTIPTLKAIITHEGPLKQLVRELAFLSGLRYTNIVRFYGAYMSPSNSEVKLVMELCEGKSLAAIGEQRKGRVGEKVARIMGEEVSRVCPVPFFSFRLCLFLFPFMSLISRQSVRPVLSGRYRGTPLDRSCKALRTCIPRKLSTGIPSHPTSSSRARAFLASSSAESARVRALSLGDQLRHHCDQVHGGTKWLPLRLRAMSMLTSGHSIPARTHHREGIHHPLGCVERQHNVEASGRD
jgi:Protein tyrosine and serine/threonine kinase